MSLAPPRIKKGAKMKPANCKQCGRAGKTSLGPSWYLCSGCVHENYAQSCLEKADYHEQRAAKLRVEAEEHKAKALEFRLRHPC